MLQCLSRISGCGGTKSPDEPGQAMTKNKTEGMAWGVGKIWWWPQELVNFACGGWLFFVLDIISYWFAVGLFQLLLLCFFELP